MALSDPSPAHDAAPPAPPTLVQQVLEAAVAIAFTWDVEKDRVERLHSSTSALPATRSHGDTFEGVLSSVHPDDRDAFRACIARLLAQGCSWAHEYRVVEPTGAVRWLSETGWLERDAGGRPQRLVGVTVDRTTQRAAEEAQAHAQAVVAALVAAAPLGVCLLDRQMRYEVVNDALAEMNGVAAADHVGRTVTEVVPALAPVAESLFSEVMASGRTVEHLVEGETPRAPGIRRTWHESWFPVRRPGGAVEGVGVVVRDVTEERRARETLEQADRQKDEFLAVLGHELRNPLAAILNAAEILRMEGVPPKRRDETLSILTRQVKHVTRLVDDLVDVARVRSGGLSLRRDTLPLAEPLAAAVEAVRPLVASRGQQLLVIAHPEPLAVTGDATRLTQVLSNLLVNAARYTQPGGRIEVETARDGDCALVRVKDDGPGIEPELLVRIFEPFRRGRNAKAQGLGLGLAVARRIAELHGGELEAHSEGRGRGSEFVVRLPLTPGSASAG